METTAEDQRRVPVAANLTAAEASTVGAVALVAGLGAAALRATITASGDTPAFVVVGPSISQIVLTIAAVACAVFAAHAIVRRRASRQGGTPAAVRSADYLTPLLILGLPVGGVAAAMWGGPAAPALVYWSWEMAPWWAAGAVALTTRQAMLAVRGSVAAPGGLRIPTRLLPVLAATGVVGWIVVGSPGLRKWQGPLGDEPRYLRYMESWSQGKGVDISRVSLLSDMPRDEPPRVVTAVGGLFAAAALDARRLAADLRSTVTDDSFRWNRMTEGDGSFVTGWGGGSFQSHQPGLSLVLMPGYAIDRYWFSTRHTYGGQFPERLPVLHATLLLITALGAWAMTVLCQRIGLGARAAAAIGFLSWASFPASAMALQIYPETCAALSIAGVLALLGPRARSLPALVLIGAAAGFPWLLHLRFILVALVLLGYGLWVLRQSSKQMLAFGAGWTVPVLLQLWFVYHATGVPWPTAFFFTAHDVLRASAVPLNFVRFWVDRDWGILPHAPVLLLAFTGYAALWRTDRALAVVAAAVPIVLTGTASTHNIAAGGTTPDRLVTAMVPLLFVPVAAALRERREHRLFLLLAAVLVLLTLDQAWDYNRAHVKGSGVLMSPGAGGWRVNLLFPYLTNGITSAAAPALAVAGIVIALLIATGLGIGKAWLARVRVPPLAGWS